MVSDGPRGLAPFVPAELEDFKRRVSPLIGLDLTIYKPRQIERRVAALMSKANAPDLASLLRGLEADPARLEAFVDGLLINVTEFFRDGERFHELETRVLPDLLARFGRLKIWSAGCSLGAELYSVGMVLETLGALEACDLVGTDRDAEALRKAELGLYTPHEVRSLPAPYRERYFSEEGGLLRMHAPAIRARTRFAAHNLLEAPPEPDCHLVLCRNVVIYLGEAGKERLYQRLEAALVPGGVLFVGNTERIFNCGAFGLEPLAPFFYRKPAGGEG